MRILLAVALAALALGGVAQAEEYGKSGVVELGGAFGFQSGTVVIEPESGPKTEYTTTEMRVSPTLGFFVKKDIQAVARLSLVNLTIDVDGAKNTGTAIGVDLGGNYLVPVGTMRIGPQILAGYSTASSKNDTDDSEYSQSGPALEAGAVVKVPVGGGGVLGAGIGFRYSMETFEADFGGGKTEGSATSTNLGMNATFSVFF